MLAHDEASFAARDPTAKKIFRVPKPILGVHERWSGDGHDKLKKIGFPIWMLVDEGSSRILKAWVVPDNRLGDTVVYCFLDLVEELGGVFFQLFLCILPC